MGHDLIFYGSTNSRVNKRQERHDKINDLIKSYLSTVENPVDAESICAAIIEMGQVISISSTYTKLKKLVDAGLITKNTAGYNRNFYHKI